MCPSPTTLTPTYMRKKLAMQPSFASDLLHVESLFRLTIIHSMFDGPYVFCGPFASVHSQKFFYPGARSCNFQCKIMAITSLSQVAYQGVQMQAIAFSLYKSNQLAYSM